MPKSLKRDAATSLSKHQRRCLRNNPTASIAISKKKKIKIERKRCYRGLSQKVKKETDLMKTVESFDFSGIVPFRSERGTTIVH